jgi:hypothetical protein
MFEAILSSAITVVLNAVRIAGVFTSKKPWLVLAAIAAMIVIW